MTATKTTRRQSISKKETTTTTKKKQTKSYEMPQRTAPQAARIYVHNQDFNALVLILQIRILVKDQSY